ncbi:hypothetical protein CDL12_21285 [Handroanthus impetiginosus]|uniref:Zinc knuckle CX2CX4HX4C domain-containing protein n=1 Tax=Handroanthus impetiginosus TaxID=429701 RepID=A0A2G9GLS7_9LAMI|nr:hypothetical protein CDL12_21285 [Handroanthus impetiginosus]
MATDTSIMDIIEHTSNLKCSDNKANCDIAHTNKFTIITKVITNKAFNGRALKATLTRAWGLGSNITINYLGQNMLAFVWSTPILIQAINIPIMFINETIARSIADSIGSFIKVDLPSEGHRWKKAFHFRVSMNIHKPLVDHIILKIKGRTDLLVEIHFERLGDFCFSCSRLGHKFDGCPKVSLDCDGKAIQRFGECLHSEKSSVLNPLFKKSPKVVTDNY